MIHANIKTIECPHCLTQFDAAFKPSDEGRKHPKPGDPSLCLMCGKISVFDEKMNARMPNEEEMDGFVGEMYAHFSKPGPKEHLAKAIAAWTAGRKVKHMTEGEFAKIMEECTSIDANGKMTFLLGKILDKMDIPRTKKNMDYLSDTLEAIVRKHYPSVPIMHTVVKPGGIGGESNDEQSLAQ